MGNMRWIDFHLYGDACGVLTATGGGQTIPFDFKRVSYVSDVVANRPGHSYRDTHEVIICLTGKSEIELLDEARSKTYPMEGSHLGLRLLPLLVIRLLRFAPGTVTLVLADTHHAPTQSIRIWDQSLPATQARSAGATPPPIKSAPGSTPTPTISNCASPKCL